MVRRFVPRLEVFDDRCLPSVTVSPPGSGFLTITSNDDADTIVIKDNGTAEVGAVTVFVNNAMVWTSGDQAVEPIRVIEVFGNGGNDILDYSLTGDLVVSRMVNAFLGAGNDKFTANFSGRTFASDAEFIIQAHGEAGKDTFNIYAQNVSVIGTSKAPQVFLMGGRGRDTFNVNLDVSGLFPVTTQQRR